MPEMLHLHRNSMNAYNLQHLNLYWWNFGGGGASPATATTNNAGPVTYTTPGTYTITHIVTAVGGCVSTTTSSVTIYPMPTVTVPAKVAPAGVLVNEFKGIAMPAQ